MHKAALLFIAVLLMLSACSGVNTKVPGVSGVDVAVEQQTQRRIAAEAEIAKKQKAMERKAKHNARLAKVGALVMQAGIDVCTYLKKNADICVYEIELLDDTRTINAFADGNKIMITSGMMSFLKTDAELATVLAHEYAHNLANHSGVAALNTVLGTLAGAMVDAAAGYGGKSGFADLGAELGRYAYSHDQEKEADYIGLYVAARAGFNIKNAPDIWRRLSKKYGERVMEASISHPSNPERFVAMNAIIQEISEKRRQGKDLLPELKR